MTCAVALTSTIAAGSYGTSTVAVSGSFAVSNLAGTSASTASGFPMSWTVDRQAPVVGATSRSTNSVSTGAPCGSSSITLTASITDNNSGVQIAYVRLYRDNVLMGTYQMSWVIRSTTWTRTFTYAQLGSPVSSAYRYEFQASDRVGNASAWYSNAGWTFTAGVCIT
jgi:hypothetical protein